MRIPSSPRQSRSRRSRRSGAVPDKRAWPIAQCALWVTLALAAARAEPAGADELSDRDSGRILLGSVLDKATGTPIAGAIVAAGDLETTTRADGRFALAGVPTGWIDLVEAAVPDRPPPRRAVPSYLFAMSSRYQRRIVSASPGRRAGPRRMPRPRDDSTARVVDWHPERESSRIHLAVSFGKKYLCACR